MGTVHGNLIDEFQNMEFGFHPTREDWPWYYSNILRKWVLLYRRVLHDTFQFLALDWTVMVSRIHFIGGTRLVESTYIEINDFKLTKIIPLWWCSLWAHWTLIIACSPFVTKFTTTFSVTYSIFKRSSVTCVNMTLTKFLKWWFSIWFCHGWLISGSFFDAFFVIVDFIGIVTGTS